MSGRDPTWEREMLRTLTEIRDGQVDMRGDIQRMARMMARRWGSLGSDAPQRGDHVVYHVRPGVYLPAVILEVHEGGHLDLEVFGVDPKDPARERERFPRSVTPGFEPGNWHFPGESRQGESPPQAG